MSEVEGYIHHSLAQHWLVLRAKEASKMIKTINVYVFLHLSVRVKDSVSFLLVQLPEPPR